MNMQLMPVISLNPYVKSKCRLHLFFSFKKEIVYNELHMYNRFDLMIKEKLCVQIFSYKIKYSSELPSIAQLCNSYNVGRKTIHGALAKIEDERMIDQDKRISAKVIFDLEKANDYHMFKYSPYIEDVYDVMLKLLAIYTNHYRILF